MSEDELLPRYGESSERMAPQAEEAMRDLARTATMQGTALALACEAFYRHLGGCMRGEEGKDGTLFRHEEVLQILVAAVGHMRI